jgi:hypothetical protein
MTHPPRPCVPLNCLGVAAIYSESGQLGVDRRIQGLAEQLGISRDAIVSGSRFMC